MSAVGSRMLTQNNKETYMFFGKQKSVEIASVYCYREQNLVPSLNAHEQALVHRAENQVIVFKYEISRQDSCLPGCYAIYR
jgi:hypothetical protein